MAVKRTRLFESEIRGSMKMIRKWYGCRMISFLFFFFLFVTYACKQLVLLIRIERMIQNSFWQKERWRREWYPLIDLLNKVNYSLDVDGRAKIASGILLSCQSLLNEKPLYKLCRRRYTPGRIFTERSMISDIIHHRSIRFVFKSYHLSNVKKKLTRMI